MAKWIFTRANGPWSYPTLGFTATLNDVIEADNAPDAWWEETDSGATVTIPVEIDSDFVETPGDSVLAYDQERNEYGPKTLDELMAGGGIPLSTSAVNTAITSGLSPAAAQAIADTDQLRGTFAEPDAITPAKHMQVSADGAARTVVLTGHSLMYGQDTSATGTTAAANGATQTRSSHPTTVEFDRQAGFVSFGGRTVVNQGYPGDRTEDALSRWAAGVSGDVEIFWIDTNDAMNYASRPGGTLTDAGTRANMWSLAKRARDRGADVIVVGGAPVASSSASRKIFASAESERAVAERLGAFYVDAGELLADVADTTAEPWTDGVHFVPAAFSLIGARLAALLGPKGMHPPIASPGRVLTWRDQAHVGATLTTRATGISGRVLTVANGSTCAIPFTAEGPVKVRYKLRIVGACTIEIFRNLDINRGPVRYDLALGGGAYEEHVWVTALATMSAGPSTIALRPVGASVEIMSVEFQHIAPEGSRRLALPTVGGLSPVRGSTSWDAALDLDSAVALYSNGTPVNRQWLFSGDLGPTSCGVLLAASQRVNPSNGAVSSYLIHTGLMIFRNGTSLVIRSMVDGSASGSDTTVASAFSAATGILQALIEVSFVASTGDLLIYLNGTLVHTIVSAPYKTLMAGVVSGATSGTPYASLSGSVR